MIDGVIAAEELPEPFIAVTVNVTGVPLVRLKLAVETSAPTVIGLPTDGVIMYPVIAEPPVEAGGVHETVAELIPTTVVISVGAPGSEADGVTATEEESKELLTAFIAETVNVTGLPFVRLVSVVVKTSLPTVIGLPTDGVMIYPVIAEPPSDAGGFQVTVAEPLPLDTETPVGVLGGVAGVTGDGVIVDEELPEAFIAVTVNVTGVPLVRLVKVAVETSAPTVIGLPTEGVTVYPVIGELPLETGGFHETVAELIPGTVVMPVGAPGSEADGVTGVVEEVKELPRAFMATTVNVTSVPLVRLKFANETSLPTVIGLPTDGVMMYPVIGEPPSDAGGFQVTVAEPLPLDTETPVIAAGGVAGVTGDGTEDDELPEAFIAVTVNVTGVPFVRLLKLAVKTSLPTVIGLPTDGVIM